MTVDASFATFLWHFYFIVVFSIKRKTKNARGLCKHLHTEKTDNVMVKKKQTEKQKYPKHNIEKLITDYYLIVLFFF